MKKNPKQIAAIIALVLIAALIISFIVSAFGASTDSDDNFFIMFFAIIAVPIISWLFLLCYGRLKGEHSIAELFPKEWQPQAPLLDKNPDNEDFTDDELTQAMEEAKTNKDSNLE